MNRGFTILETMIAIFMVSLAIAGASFAAQGGIKGGSIAKEEVKAFYLAQEAIEVLANKRDSNELAAYNGSAATNWLTGIADQASDPCYPGKTCMVEAPNQTLTYCGAAWGSCSYLLQDSSTYLHGYSNGSQTPFKREIQIERTGNNEILITVLISWSHSGQTREFKTKSILTNWFRATTSES